MSIEVLNDSSRKMWKSVDLIKVKSNKCSIEYSNSLFINYFLEFNPEFCDIRSIDIFPQELQIPNKTTLGINFTPTIAGMDELVDGDIKINSVYVLYRTSPEYRLIHSHRVIKLLCICFLRLIRDLDNKRIQFDYLIGRTHVEMIILAKKLGFESFEQYPDLTRISCQNLLANRSAIIDYWNKADRVQKKIWTTGKQKEALDRLKEFSKNLN